MTPIPSLAFIEPMHIKPTVRMPRNLHIRTSLAQLCQQAKIPMRYTGPCRTIIVHHGRRQIRTSDVFLVGIPRSAGSLHSRKAALRALEVLAHSFFDHAARHCVVGRGLFCAPVMRGEGENARYISKM